MHPLLADFSSAHFYNGCLASHPAPEDRMQPPGFPWPQMGVPLAFVAVRPHAIGHESSSQHSTSFQNCPEAMIVAQTVERLVAAGVAPGDIGVMTPYSAQVNLLNQLLNERLMISCPEAAGMVECSSVDAFQGREKEVVVISTVRSNTMAALGFLTDWRRLNVAITRARSGMIIVGDRDTLLVDRYWGRLLAFIGSKQAILLEQDLLDHFAAEPLQSFGRMALRRSNANFLLDPASGLKVGDRIQ